MAILRSNGILIVDAIPVHTPVDTQAIIAWDNVLDKFYIFNGSAWVTLQSTLISDTAYNEAAYNGVGDVAVSQNVFRDVIESLAAGILPDGDYGDITVSGSGTVISIDSNAVTFAKLQNISSDVLVGRDTAASGDPEEISVGGGVEFTGAGGIQRSALTGDITAPAGSNSTTLSNNVVTDAKLADMPTDTIKGRDTAGSGDPENLTLDPTLEFTGSGSIRRAAITGDVTIAAGSNAAVIPNDTVAYEQIQNVSATDRILGRVSAGSGDIEEIPITDFAQTLLAAVDESALAGLVNLEVGVDVQAWDATLDALAAFNTNGIMVQTALNTFAGRTLIGTANEITITNGDGVAGNPTISFPTTIDLGGKTSFEIPNSAAPTVNADGEIAIDTTIADFSHGLMKIFAGEELVVVSIPIAEISGMSDGDVIKYNATADEFQLAPEAALDATLVALAAYNTNGILTQTAPDTFVGRTITGTANEISVGDGNGVAGNPTISLPNTIDLGGKTSFEIPNSAAPTVDADGEIAVDTTVVDFSHGIVKVFAGEETALISVPIAELTAPANGDAPVYDSTADEFQLQRVQMWDAALDSLAALAVNGFPALTAADTYTMRTITGTANEVTVLNGDGLAGDPTLSLPAEIDLGGKTSLEIPNAAAPTVDADGEVAIDTTVTDFSHGLIKYFAGEELAVIAVPVVELTSPVDGSLVEYNATDDEFKLTATPKIYKVLINQTGTGAPTVTDTHKNTLGGSPAYARPAQGTYTITLLGAFALNKTHIQHSVSGKHASIDIVHTSANVLTITSKAASDEVGLTDLEGNIYLTVEVYP